MRIAKIPTVHHWESSNHLHLLPLHSGERRTRMQSHWCGCMWAHLQEERHLERSVFFHEFSSFTKKAIAGASVFPLKVSPSKYPKFCLKKKTHGNENHVNFLCSERPCPPVYLTLWEQWKQFFSVVSSQVSPLQKEAKCWVLCLLSEHDMISVSLCVSRVNLEFRISGNIC